MDYFLLVTYRRLFVCKNEKDEDDDVAIWKRQR